MVQVSEFLCVLLYFYFIDDKPNSWINFIIIIIIIIKGFLFYYPSLKDLFLLKKVRNSGFRKKKERDFIKERDVF